MRMNEMIDYREGAKCRVLCANCGKATPATLKNETVSLCEGLEEVENTLVYVCDLCGSMSSVPHKSVGPLQQAFKRLVDSNSVSDYGEITIELKSQVDEKKAGEGQSETDFQHKYPMQATG